MTRVGEVRRVLLITLALNISSALLKIGYGYVSGIRSMQADGFHSLFDGVSNVIGLIGIWIASKPPDSWHHYGHRKVETTATIVIALFLFITCFEIFREGISGLLNPGRVDVTGVSFAVILFSISVNIIVASYEYRRGRVLKSDFLIADARHTMSDLLASTAVLVSLFSAGMGYPLMDPAAAIFIAVMIGRLGYQILKEALWVLVDSSPLIGRELARVAEIACAVEGVRECHDVRVRGRSDAVHIDCHILVSPDMNMSEAHEIADMVEKRIKMEMPEVEDVLIHLEPKEEG